MADKDMRAIEQELERHHELSHQRDLAAYSVLGAARVLFLLVADKEMAKSGLDAIAEYDRRNAELAKFNADAGALHDQA